MRWTVLTSSKSKGIGSGLTYESDTELPIGSMVHVPLQRKVLEGIVLAKQEKETQEVFDVKKITGILGNKPLLTESQIKTLLWMADHYCCTVRQALGAFLPSPPWNALLPTEEVFYKAKANPIARGKKQQIVLDVLSGRDWLSAQTLKNETGATEAVLKNMMEKGMIERKVELPQLQKPILHITKPALTPSQQVAYKSTKTDKRPTLLFGITGSGKTEIYAQMIVDTILSGKQAILLVPEILLTEHSIHRFRALLGPEALSVLHSRLTPATKRDEWKRIHAGEVSLVIGSRSALFAPLQNLGLVVIDEEHEWTYKNEQTPRYHARETAEALCKAADAKLILGTATPSVESWTRAKDGRYHMAELPDRYNDNQLPSVSVVDLADVAFGKNYPFSPALLGAIEQRLQKGEQSVLLLNRRGSASALLCLECRRRITSPDSKLPFTVHQSHQGPYLMDHTSGLRAALPGECPSCGSTRLHAVGAGTQKVEQILKSAFPTARILRADSDTLTSPDEMRTLLETMKSNGADILLGTQSVAKGLDLPNVTLAAVLVADIGLSLPHFRAGERIFHILTQLTGRSGRAKPGDVIIQTFRPQAPEVLFAAEHKTREYLEQELKLRMHLGYPPASDMVRLICRGAGCSRRAKELQKNVAEQYSDLSVSAAPTLFGGGEVWHVLIRGKNPKRALHNRDLEGVVVDIDPIECV